MSKERDPEQIDPEALVTSSAESAEPDTYSDDPVNASLIERYGFTPQQAKEMSLYL